MRCKKCKYLTINAFALLGRIGQLNMTPGVPLRSAPGCVLVAPLGRILPMSYNVA